jgi:ankyrin repeat protein
MVRLLVQVPEINIEATSRGGETPMMCAVESGSNLTLAECLNSGCNPFSFNCFLLTPMDIAKKFPNV